MCFRAAVGVVQGGVEGRLDLVNREVGASLRAADEGVNCLHCLFVFLLLLGCLVTCVKVVVGEKWAGVWQGK